MRFRDKVTWLTGVPGNRLKPSCVGFLVGALWLAVTAQADVTLASLFQDRAVLQHGKPVPIWGWADPGEEVSVWFAGQRQTTLTTPQGFWSVTLTHLSPSAQPQVLTVKGKNTIVLNDILVGEVWLASGQSNMAWTVASSDGAAEVIAAANRPLIRQIEIQKRVSETPLQTTKGVWKAASPQTVREFSAVGWFFACELHESLNGIPVGIINCSWGGTRIEAWMSPVSLGADFGPAFALVHERWAQVLARYPDAKATYEERMADWNKARAAAAAEKRPFTQGRPGAPLGPGHKDTPGGLYNGMLHPLLPYALAGVIWYQGEHNINRPEEYHDFFVSLITDWRRAFHQENLPFLWVQLANFGSPQATRWAFLREAQTQTLELPHTGQAVTIDIGNPADIHPRNKLDVGRRLSRLALNRVYGRSMIDSGPVYAGAEPVKTKGVSGVRISFNEVHGGLKLDEAKHGFEIAGANKVFHPAEARLQGDAVIVSSANVAEPVAVRYAWRDAALSGLYNGEGLPAVPFRTDSW